MLKTYETFVSHNMAELVRSLNKVIQWESSFSKESKGESTEMYAQYLFELFDANIYLAHKGSDLDTRAKIDLVVEIGGRGYPFQIKSSLHMQGKYETQTLVLLGKKVNRHPCIVIDREAPRFGYRLVVQIVKYFKDNNVVLELRESVKLALQRYHKMRKSNMMSIHRDMVPLLLPNDCARSLVLMGLARWNKDKFELL